MAENFVLSSTFTSMDTSEMMCIDGGFTWNKLAGAIIAGGVVGGLGGAAAGGFGAGPGALVGALGGGVAYCITDIFDYLFA